MLRGDPRIPIIVGTNAANAGFDIRLFDPKAPDHPDSKINRAVRNLMAIYNGDKRATQVIFMERGFSDQGKKSTGTKDKDGKTIYEKVAKFNLAKDIVAKLIEQGVPREQIAIVDGSTSKEKRKEIADKMNRSEIRVVIGNTKTLGVGVNMQTNLRAMHHLDAPWMPGDLEQRNGRGWRQGNKWNTVLEYRYITEKLDGRRWQVLAIKQRFITAFLKADESVRVIEGDAEGRVGFTLCASLGFGDMANETRAFGDDDLAFRLHVLRSASGDLVTWLAGFGINRLGEHGAYGAIGSETGGIACRSWCGRVVMLA